MTHSQHSQHQMRQVVRLSDLVHLHFRLTMREVAKLTILPLPAIAIEETDAKTAANLSPHEAHEDHVSESGVGR